MSSPFSSPARGEDSLAKIGDPLASLTMFPPLSSKKLPTIYSLSQTSKTIPVGTDSPSRSFSGLKINSARDIGSKTSSPLMNRELQSIPAGIGSSPKSSSGLRTASAHVDRLKNSSPSIDRDFKAKSTYLNVVDNSLALKFSIDSNHVAGSDVLDIPQKVLDDSVPLWKDLIVGRFLDTPPHVGVTQVIVNKIWNVGAMNIKIIATVLEERLVQFKVSDEKMRNKILERGMWTIAKVPMIVSAWSPAVDESEPILTTMPLWITIKNIPRCLFSRVGIGYLASAAGTPRKLHQDTELCKKIDEAKVFMDLNLTKELPTKLFVKETNSGVVTKLTFHYPWLPSRCSGCGKWGHLQAKCKVLKKSEDVPTGNNLQVIPEGTNVERIEVVVQPTDETSEKVSGLCKEKAGVDRMKADIGYVYKDLVSYSNSLKKGIDGKVQGSMLAIQMDTESGEVTTNKENLQVNPEDTNVERYEVVDHPPGEKLTEASDSCKNKVVDENVTCIGSEIVQETKAGNNAASDSIQAKVDETKVRDILVNKTQGISKGNPGKEVGETDHGEWITPSRPIKNPKLLSKNQQIVLETRFEALVQEDDTALGTDSIIDDDLLKDTEWLSPSHPIKSPMLINKKSKPIILDTPYEEIDGFYSDSDCKSKRKYGKYHYLVSFDLDPPDSDSDSI